MNRRTGPRILSIVAVLTMVASAVGFIAMLALNAFVLDEYDAYGEVPIPGSAKVVLPAGDVTVTFHTVLIGGSGSSLPVPPLKYRIAGPDGADAELSKDYGSTTTVNNDARVRIGYLHVPVEGAYDVTLDGNVSAYVNPTLAFGHGTRYGSVPWICAAIFALAVVDLIIARSWASRVKRTPPVNEYYEPPTLAAPPADPYTPTDQGVRIEQLETLARLRASGALSEFEYAAEKKRVLDGR